ncbi:Gfo/Idh/MocA family protein [Haladaptatus halobius]|uniref:Gfo/Idh/MocA family protein n=1 Tax=Haladaptatus halobius TaxID=2884875 RepID=UPI001D0B0F0C|nr:Gfo/Idh/MocA family oxidoreductase [Haladaptatus halobius]
MTLNIAILGLASFYGPAYADRAASHPDCEVVAAFPGETTDEQRTSLGCPTDESFASEYDCQLYHDVDELLEAGSINAAVVTTKTRRRADDACAVLDAGSPVLTAKPAANSPQGATEISAAAVDANLPAVTTSPARFDDAVATLGRRVHNGAVGDVVSVRASIRHDRVPEAGIETNAEHAPEEAGSIYAMGFYTADALLWLADDTPERLSGELSHVNTPYSTHPDLGAATVYFANGTIGEMSMTYTTDCRDPLGNWEVEVVGTDGILRTSHHGYEGIHWHAGEPADRHAEVFGRVQSPILDRQFDAFINAVETDSCPDAVPPAPEQVADALTLCAAWETAASEGTVDL